MFKRKKIEANKMSKEEVEKKLRETPLEKGDLMAMVIAGLGVFLPVVLIICGVFVAVIWLVFLR